MTRKQWTDIDQKTRKSVLDRDGHKCILCNSTYNLTLAHIFLSRAKGGKGCKENLVTLCSRCHYYIVDNPIGTKYNELSKKYKERLKTYLIIKENIDYNEEFIESLKYRR